MNAEAFLSAYIEIALAIAGFAGIVAAIRQRRLSAWPPEQLILLQILFTASAAAVFSGLLPSFVMETGVGEVSTWKISSLWLLGWMIAALGFRRHQSKALGVDNQIPRVVQVFGLAILPLQVYNAGWAGLAWPYLLGIMTLLMNGFSVFLSLVLMPSPDTEGPD